VDKIFRVHKYSERKRVAMAALEFDGYALIWWEQMLNEREEVGQGDVRSWAEMKRELRARFVPKHYRCDLFDKCLCFPYGGSHQRVNLFACFPCPDGDAKRHKDLS